MLPSFDEEGGRIYLNGQLSDSHNWRGDYGAQLTHPYNLVVIDIGIHLAAIGTSGSIDDVAFMVLH